MTYLSEIELHNFRLFSQLQWRPEPGINFVAGANGAGKSSILEAIYFLGRNRSFRASRSAELIKNPNISARHSSLPPSGDGSAVMRRGTAAPAVDAHTKIRAVINAAAGSANSSDRSLARNSAARSSSPHTDEVTLLLQATQATAAKQLYFNRSPQHASAKIARKLPLVLVAPHNVNLVDAAPSHRRAFLDGVIFHTEPDYGGLLQRYERCLRQRNKALLQSTARRDYQLLSSWDEQLAELGHQLEARRQAILPQLLKSLQETVSYFSLDQCEINYYCGWNKEQHPQLTQALAANYHKDLLLAFTGCGCHRADFKLSIKSRPAQRILSLGQQKLFSLSFFCAAAKLLETARPGGALPLILLDDIATQLDEANCGLLINYFLARKNQVFITATGNENLVKYDTSKDGAFWHLSDSAIARSTH